MSALDIIIVSYNARADLVHCLLSVKKNPPSIPHEVVVVDNASTDGSVEAARKIPGVRVVEMGRNAGFSAANNAGIRATSGKLILLLNSDTLVPPGALDTLVAALDRAPRTGVVGPRLVDAEGRPELSFGRMISPFNEWRQKRRTPDWIARETAREQFVDWVSGACLLVRRIDAEAVQLLDERYFLYWEDVDFCTAIRNSGRLVLFTPVAEIVHLRGRSAAGHRSAVNQAYRKGQLAFYEKHRPGWLPFVRSYLARTGRMPR